MSIGMKIWMYRKQKKLTQQQLAEKVGLTLHTISKIETGKSNGTVDNLKKIAEALDVNIKDFFDE